MRAIFSKLSYIVCYIEITAFLAIINFILASEFAKFVLM